MSSYPPTSPPTLLSTGTVTVISALIPDQIADSVFKLDSEEKSAAVVWDWDQKNFIKSPYENSNSKASLQARPNIYDESADGSKQIADALDNATKEHKRILLQFGPNWCGWCHKLHHVFETDKSIAEELKSDYVVVMIDVNKGHNNDIDTKYGHPTRFGLPAIVVLDADGKQLITQDTGKLEEGDHHSPVKVMVYPERMGAKKIAMCRRPITGSINVVGALSSAFAGHVVGPAWLSSGVRQLFTSHENISPHFSGLVCLHRNIGMAGCGQFVAHKWQQIQLRQWTRLFLKPMAIL